MSPKVRAQKQREKQGRSRRFSGFLDNVRLGEGSTHSLDGLIKQVRKAKAEASAAGGDVVKVTDASDSSKVRTQSRRRSIFSRRSPSPVSAAHGLGNSPGDDLTRFRAHAEHEAQEARAFAQELRAEAQEKRAAAKEAPRAAAQLRSEADALRSENVAFAGTFMGEILTNRTSKVWENNAVEKQEDDAMQEEYVSRFLDAAEAVREADALEMAVPVLLEQAAELDEDADAEDAKATEIERLGRDPGLAPRNSRPLDFAQERRGSPATSPPSMLETPRYRDDSAGILSPKIKRDTEHWEQKGNRPTSGESDFASAPEGFRLFPQEQQNTDRATFEMLGAIIANQRRLEDKLDQLGDQVRGRNLLRNMCC